MELLQVIVHKDSANKVSKQVTREEAEALAGQFVIDVATPDGFKPWAEFDEASKKALAKQGADTLASLLKRKNMKRSAFDNLDQDAQDRLLVEESATMAADADIAAGKAGAPVVTAGTNSAV